ncbi:TonB-dependent receptor plug domain-containing protein [uncultured Paenalcaligenes sp.]|uniref:TonB-dependent receptor plug domain-containing protein n=1 Tax=uncultured Paenalcaligenes sp. TaxID=1588925 RepID=UPI00262112F8|nr:TonB-dependent receptor plug domain-containing protein [uncultured Paenalcaligenes sp.]
MYSRSNAGQQSIKLSIRGSGLASPLAVRGLTLLQDGLPLKKTDGTIDPAYADPFNTQYLEIYRGADALQYGAATLGGAINLVSPTGILTRV